MLEKRRYGRLDTQVPVILRYGGRLIPATMLNLSTGGMYLRVDNSKIDTSGRVEVIFDLNNTKRDIAMRGQITRIEDESDHKGVGVQFTNLFSLSHKAIQKYVTEHIH